jgi:hypothetical protein
MRGCGHHCTTEGRYGVRFGRQERERSGHVLVGDVEPNQFWCDVIVRRIHHINFVAVLLLKLENLGGRHGLIERVLTSTQNTTQVKGGRL